MNEKQKIAYLGPKGSYTEVATEAILRDFTNKDFTYEAHNSIIKVIELVNSDINYVGIVPIENSIEGIVRETVDNLLNTREGVYITKETIIPISHCLISKSKNIGKINKIMSIGQALAQCQHYISRTFSKNAELIYTTSTSEAVKQLIDLPDNYAAIGNAKAAEIYGLNIIEYEINDIKDNKTRFVCLGSHIPKPTGNDKTSMAFFTSNEPGSLVNILNAFKENNLNLSYIESRPSKEIFGEYTFFIDFDAHIQNKNVQAAIDKISPLLSWYRILGSYGG